MRVSTKARSAVNALVDLALHEGAGPVALSTIAQRQRVSLSYLEQMFSCLRRDGVVESTRGPGGGYTLGRAADAISVADVVAAIDGPVSEMDGSGEAEGPAAALWQRLGDVLRTHMAGITLQSLVDEQTARGAVVRARPVRRAFVPPTPRLRTLAPNSVFAFGQSFGRSFER